MANFNPHTPEQIEHLRKIALEREAQKREQKKQSQGNHPGDGAEKDNRGGADHGSGGASSAGGPGNKPSGGANSDGGPGGNAGDTGTANGRKIPKKAGLQEVLLNENRFLEGLPFLVRWHIKAATNLMKVWNWLPFPLKIEFEPFSKEEYDDVAEGVKPGLKKALPNLGQKHPFGMMIYTVALVLFAKVKVFFNFKKPMKDAKAPVKPENNQSEDNKDD